MLRTLALAFVAVALCTAPSVSALVSGTYPSSPQTWRVYGKAVQLGASLVTNFTDYRFNDQLLSQSSDTVQSFEKIPSDAVIKQAYLFWAGSAAGPLGNESADQTATLTFADGASESLTADNCVLRNIPTNNGGSAGRHFYCRKDVTSLVTAHPGGDSWNGTYSVGSVTAKVAQITTQCNGLLKANQQACPGAQETVCCQPSDPYCQGRHASWSLLIVYDTKFSETVQRDVFLWDGFVVLDERLNSAGQINIPISDFYVGDPPQADLMYYAMEGDKHLGEPVQSSSSCDSTPCGTCFDFIAFNGTKLSGGAGNSDVNNIFNSTPETSIDLDRFDVSQLVKPKDTTGNILVSSGDGNIGNNSPNVFNGYGELVLYGYTVLEVNRLAPNYKNPVTNYTVNATEASSGETLTYTIDLLNSGQLDADPTIVTLQAFPPAGTEYVPGTTLIDGKTIPDVGGTSPIASGMSLGNVTAPTGGNASRKVQFKLKVTANPGVTAIVSKAKLSYTYKGTVTSFTDSVETNETSVKVVAPQLATPVLSVSSAQVGAGETFSYFLSLENASGAPLTVNEVLFDLPKEANFVSAVSSANATDQSAASGGANGTGVARFVGLALPSGGKATITINAKLKSAADLTALGIAPLNGHKVGAQANVTVGVKVYQSDDPKLPGGNDPTEFSVSAQADLSQSSKEGLDLSPGTPLSAGDEMQFSIAIVNSGPGDVTLNLSDPLPAAIEFISSLEPEITHAAGIVSAAGVNVKAGQTKTLSFKARVLASVPPGTSFSNAATLSPTDGSPPVVVKTGTFTVTGGPNVTTSTKSVEDLNGGAIEPGDTLRYTILVTNSGQLPSGNLTVTDPVPVGLEQVSAITGGGSYNAAANTVTWAVPSLLANGGKRVLTFEAKVSATAVDGTKLINQAIIDGPELKASVPVNVESVVEAKAAISTFSLSVANAGSLKPNDQVVYTVTVKNTGKGPVSGATLTLPLDPSLEFVSASGGGTLSNGVVTWSAASVPANGPELSFTLTAKLKPVLPQLTPVSAQVSLTGAGLSGTVLSDDPSTAAAQDPTKFEVQSAPVVSLTKSVVDLNGGVAQGGDTLEFTIAVVNTGDAPATNLVITDDVNAALTAIQVTGGSVTGAKVTWATIATLNPGDPAQELKFRATIAKSTPTQQQITNIAQASFKETPNSAVSNTVALTVQNQADFGASVKTVSAPVIAAGDTVTWTLEITNSGNDQGTSVVVTDVVPQEVINVTAVGGSFDASTRTATWTLASLAAGAKQTLTLQGQVVSPLANDTQVCNQATIKAAGVGATSVTSPPNATPAQIGQPTCFKVSSAAKLVLIKDVFDVATGQKINGGLVKPTTALRYEIRLTNEGNAVATDVKVSDVVTALLGDVAPLDGGSFSAATSTLTWPTITSLSPGAAGAKLFRFTAKVQAALDNGTAIDNQASATDGTTTITSDDPNSPALGDATRVNVVSNVDLGPSTKSFVDDNGGQAEPGDKLTWTILVSNQGDATAKDVVVTDPVDPRLGQIATANGGVVNNGVITWKIGDLLPGTSAAVNFSTVIATPQIDGAQIPNQAQVIAQGFQAPVLTDADLATPQREPTVVPVQAKADMASSEWTVDDVNGGTIEPGDELVFQLKLKNTGNALATNVSVVGLSDANQLEDLKPFDGGVVNGQSVQWQVPLVGLSPGGDVLLRMSARVKSGLLDGDKITVAAQISGVTPGPELTVQVESKPNFSSSTLSVDDETGWLLKLGQTGPDHTLRVAINLVNGGKVAASQVQMKLPIGDLLDSVQLVTPGAVAGGVVTWTLPKLAAGGSAQFVLRGKVKASLADGFAFNPVATVGAAELSVEDAINGPTVTVLKRPLVKLTKTAEDVTGGQLFPGDTVRFSITAANVGNAPAEPIVITDNLDDVALIDVVPGPGGVLSGQSVVWSVAKLDVNQTVTVSLTGKVAQTVTPGDSIVNVASATAAPSAPVASNPATLKVDYATLKVEALYIPEAPAQAPVKPGDVVTLRAVVTSDGSFDATNTQVTFPVDTSLFEVLDVGTGVFNGAAKVVSFTSEKTPSLSSLPPGQQTVLNVKLRVRSTAPNGSEANTTVAAREGQTKLSYTSSPATLKVVSVPELQVDKRVEDVNGGKVRPLDLLRYKISVRVKGKAAALNARVSDILPETLEIVAVGQGGSTEGSKVVWDAQSTPALAAVKPGDEVTLEVEARVRPEVGDNSLISNQAFTNADALLTPVGSDDPNTPAQGDATVVTVRVDNPLEQSTKSVVDDNGAPLLVGETVTWRIRVVATANQPLTGVKLRDPIPAGCVYVAGSTRLNGAAVEDTAGVSAVVSGLLVNSAGQPPGTLLSGQANAAEVTFQTRVSSNVLDGTSVSNIATVSADGVAPLPIGPAAVTVGKGPNLSDFRKTVQIIDENGNGQADVGEVLLYTLEVRNTGAGAAKGVQVTDVLPKGVAYVATTLTVNGSSVTDSKDGDNASVAGGVVRAELGTLEAGKSAQVSFKVRPALVGVVSNQALVVAQGLGEEPSDSDGDDSNGDQPTLTPVGITGPALQVTKQVQDEDGGDVQPGDWLRYTIKLRNDAPVDALDVAVIDTLPLGLKLPLEDFLLPNGAQWNVVSGEGGGLGLLNVTGLNLKDGQTVTVSFRARVRPDAASGLTVCNQVQAQLLAQPGDRSRRAVTINAAPACVTVGVAAGQGLVAGYVFEDVGSLNETFDPKVDAVFSGWQVIVSPLKGQQGPSVTAVTDKDGYFKLPQVTSGERRVRVVSPFGVVFLDTTHDVQANEATRVDLALKPSGRLYDAKRGAVLGGLRVFLHYDATDPVAPQTLVPAEALPQGQQGQRVDSSGAYFFSPKQGRAYRIEVAAGGLPWAFPSKKILPDPAIAVLSGQGLVNDDALPGPNATSKYYLRFTRQDALGKTDSHGQGATPRHNHIPVDALQDAISLALHLSKARAQVGDVLHGTVTVVNNSSAAIAANPQTGLGGGVIRGLLPKGLGYVPGSLRISLKTADSEAASPVKPSEVQGPLLEIKRASSDSGKSLGLDLPVGGRLTARFQAVVGAGATVGAQLAARAQLFDLSGTALTQESKANLLIQPDALMDRGTVLGKVFCDADGDGKQGDKERGLGAARVYIDTGHFSDTDRAGRYHLMDIPPGHHLFKLDVNTLPPGSTLTTDVKRVLWVTRGVGLRLNFGVRCALERVTADTVVLREPRKSAPPAAKLGPGVVHVRASLNDLAVMIDSKKLPGQSVRTILLTEDSIRPAPLPSQPTSVTMELGAPLKVAAEAKGAFSNYTLVVREVRADKTLGNSVTSWSYRGRPPALVVQPFPPGLLLPGRRYAARLSARNRYGASAWGAWMGFDIASKKAQPFGRWHVHQPGPWVHLNGEPLKLDAKDQAEGWVNRPADGRLVVGLQASSGEGRNAYVSLSKTVSPQSIRPPQTGPRDDPKVTIGALIPDVEEAHDRGSSGSPAAEIPKTPKPAKAKESPGQTIPAPTEETSKPAALKPVLATRRPASAPKPTVGSSAEPKRASVATSTTLTPTQPATPAPVRAAAKPKPASGPRRVSLELNRTDGLMLGEMLLKPRRLQVTLSAPSGPVPMGRGRPLQQLVLEARGLPANPSSVSVVLMDRLGRVRLRSPLSMPLPKTFVWDAPSAGDGMLSPGVYGIALEVMVKDERGEIGWRTAPTQLELSRTHRKLVPKGPYDRVVRAKLFDDQGRPTVSMGEWLVKTAKAIEAQPKRLAVVTVHSVAPSAKARTDKAAKACEAALLAAGVDTHRLLVLSMGSMMADSNPRGAELGVDRVEVRYGSMRLAATGAAAKRPYPVSPGYWIDGKRLKADAAGKAPSFTEVPTGRSTLIEAQTIRGPANLWRRTFSQPPGAAPSSTTPQSTDSSLVGFGAELFDRLGQNQAVPQDTKRSPARLEGAADKRSAAQAAAAAAKGGAQGSARAAHHAKLPAEATVTFRTVPAAQAGAQAAADLELFVPSPTKPLGSPVFSVRGRTRVGNKVKINGRAVRVRADGSFYRRVELGTDGGDLQVHVTDPAGHVAKLKRTYKVSGKALFLMAIADTAVVQAGAHLDGMSDRTTLQAGPVQLHGRGAVYLKGRIQGKWLGFKKLRFTAHLDTSKNPAVEDFRSNLLDPDRFYPVYGDGTVDTQDVRARGMLYVLVEADRSKVLLGNFRSGVHGFELLRYDRALYGGYIELNRKFGALDTQAKLFISQQDEQVVRRTDLMRGTGGSLYYLSNRDVLDGSEKVWLIIRDRDSNIELARLPQQRNVDYNVDYREGRVVFKSPVNSAVDSFFAVGQGGQPGQHLAWNGHPVFVQVTYEARGTSGTGGSNVGVQVQEKLLKGKLTVGATYVQESRDQANATTYRVAGAHAEVKLGKRSKLRAEYAYSQARDSLVSVSDDGGLTFATGNDPQGDHLQSPVSGHALGLTLDADLRDVGQLLGLSLKKGKGARPYGHLRAHYKWVQAGFHSNGVLTEQGQQKVGLDTKLALSADNQLSVRYDGVITGQRRDPYSGLATAPAWGTGALATSGSFSALGRHTVTAQDLHKLGRFTALGAVQYTAGQDASGEHRHSVTVAGGTNYKVNDKLQLRGEQQFIVGGDPNQYKSKYLDHFTTVFGADWKLTKDVHLTLSERVGWGGQNATMAGLRTKLSKDSSLYLQQRLEDTYQTGRPMSATVIGAESRYGKDKLSRAWGEYQIDALNVGRMNRAIMGLGKRFKFGKGVTLDASYERSQTFSGASGGLSRDVFSLGFEWLRSDLLKVTSRQEIRLDEGEVQRGGQRKLQVVSLNAVMLKPTRDVQLFARANYMRTENQTLDRADSETLQATSGLAWRPEQADWLVVVGKYTHLIESRPSALAGALGASASERGVKHIVAIEPTFETPWRLQLAPKLVFRRSYERMADSPVTLSDTWLWLLRAGYHLGSMLDIAVEYRWLSTSLAEQHQHGALIEVAYILKKSLRLSLGYNFTRFTQSATGDIVDDQGGVFLRVIGMY